MPRLPGTLTLMLLAIFAWLVAAPAAQAPSRGKSAATINGAFADSCRDFAARSSKDISHVEIDYVSGLVVKDESISSPDYAIDGGAVPAWQVSRQELIVAIKDGGQQLSINLDKARVGRLLMGAQGPLAAEKTVIRR
jgi:hypothetical protein